MGHSRWGKARCPSFRVRPAGHGVAQLLADKQPGAVHPRLHSGDAEAQDFGDLKVRQALDVVQPQRGPIVGGQCVDRRDQRHPQFSLGSVVFHAR